MNDTPGHILVVDDDDKVRRMLRRCLEDEGYQVSEAVDREGVLGQLDGVDLITLDLNLGTSDGLSIARDVRAESQLPIIMITGKGDMVDRIVGLEIGADDYIAKPFHLREVLARIRSVLRRTGVHHDEAPAQPAGSDTEGQIHFDGYVLDIGRRMVTGPDGALTLTSGEFDLLVLFATHAHRVLTRDQIMDLLKGHDWAPTDRSIDNQVARLRKKIEPDPRKPVLLKTVRNAGYSFTPEKLTGA